MSRLDAEERRHAIVQAALPLFARKGFAATTTKEIAAAANVSEALIFKHFPSKAALYAEIVHTACEGEPELARLLALPPSTATLVEFVRSLLHYFAVETPADPEKRARHRLTVASFLEDGEYARLTYDWILEHIQPAFAASLAAAEAAGNLVPSPVAAANRLWFAEHLAQMLASASLPGRVAVPYGCAGEALARQGVWFALRGIGLTDRAIAAHHSSARSTETST
jgi:TetR/AcrR family transcriptional regulator, transcriptional repressor of aconitase